MAWGFLLESVFRAIPLVVKTVEVLKGRGGGKEKKVLALRSLESLLELAEGITDKDLVNDVEFKAALGDLVDAAVRLQNSIIKRKSG